MTLFASHWFTAGMVTLPMLAYSQSPVVRMPGSLAGTVAFVNVAVVPMDRERTLLNQTVVVRDGWITALGPSNQVIVPTRALRIDGTGKYLIPGLADMHVHIGSARVGADGLAVAERRLFLWLTEGITTVRNLDYMSPNRQGMNLLDGPSLLRLRARAAKGEILSPRIYTSGAWGPDHYLRGLEDRARRLDSIAAYVAAYKEAGFDFLKVHDEPQIVRDSLAVVTRRLEIPLVGHIHRDADIDEALRSGNFTSIEHLTGYLPKGRGTSTRESEFAAKIPALVAETKRAGVWTCPTLALKAEYARTDLAAARIFVKALQDTGAGLILGTDAPLVGKSSLDRGNPGGIHVELAELVAAGLTPYQALITGTRNVAQYFGTLDKSGTIAVGKRADMVLLFDNPLADIHHTARRAGVMISGRWLGWEELDRRLAALASP